MKRDYIQLLIIEDNPDDLVLLKTYLGYTPNTRFELQLTTYLQQAFDAIDRQKPDVILLDLNLPDSQGAETLLRLRQQITAIPVIVLLETNDDENLQADIIQLGAHDYLFKDNLDEKPLLRTIRHAVQRKQSEEAVLAAERLKIELEKQRELRELKETFIEMFSHEFRTPLTRILSSASLLILNEEMSRERMVNHFKKIQMASLEIANMLDKVSVFSDLMNGNITLMPRRQDIQEFARLIAAQFEQNQKVQHKIVFEAQYTCPLVNFDSQFMTPALLNLLWNAALYSEPTTPIILRVTCDQHYARLQVQDQGVGIPVKDQPHIFDMLYRGSNVNTIPGVGLGLTYAEQVVRLHGGRIRFESEVGVGSIFTIELPLGANL